MPSGRILSERKIHTSTFQWQRMGNVIDANVGEDRINPGIRILPLTSANGLLGGGMSGQKSGQLLVLRMENYTWRRMNYKLTNGMEMWKGTENTTTLLFSLKGLEILHQARRGQVKTIVMEHFNGILFHQPGPANKQHTNHSSLTIIMTSGHFDSNFLTVVLKLRNLPIQPKNSY